MTAKYSFNWAWGVVQRVRGKHARATEFLCEMLDITDRNLAKYLASGDPLWKDLRDLIKKLGELCENPRVPATDQDLYYSVLMYCRGGGKDRLKNRLTAIGFEPTLKEQSKGRVSEGLKPDETQPFILEDGLVQYTIDFGL